MFNQGFLRTGKNEELFYIGSFTNNYRKTKPNGLGSGVESISANSKYELIISLDEYGQFSLTENYRNESHQMNEGTGEYELKSEPPYSETYPLNAVVKQLSFRTFISYEENFYWFPFPSENTSLETK